MDDLILVVIGGLLCLGAVLMRRHFAAFHAQAPRDYEDEFPAFEMKRHLNGEMVCDGVIYGPLGRVTSSFTADFSIHWDGDYGVMDELFRYNDGSTQPRQWRITQTSAQRFFTEADDVPGRGEGRVSGGTVQMRYRIRLPDSSGGHVLSCVDWMYLTPDGTIMNRSQFRKFGIQVAELVATIRPKETS